MTTHPAMISIQASERKKISVNLVGVDYMVQPPKNALALRLGVQAKQAAENPSAMFDTIFEWVEQAFGKTGARAIRKRLDNTDDDLDIDHIMKLMEALTELSMGNPTSSS